MTKKRNLGAAKSNPSNEAEALDSLNARLRRKSNTRRLIEADIEANSKKRRNEQKPASSDWKRY